MQTKTQNVNVKCKYIFFYSKYCPIHTLDELHRLAVPNIHEIIYVYTFANSIFSVFVRSALLFVSPSVCSFSSNCFSVQQRKWSINIVADPQWLHETQNVHKSCLMHPASFKHGCVPTRLPKQCKTNQFRCETCSYLYVTVTQYTTWIDFDPKAFIHTHTDRNHRITSYNLCLSDVIYWISSSQWRFCHLVSPNTTYFKLISKTTEFNDFLFGLYRYLGLRRLFIFHVLIYL